MIPVDSPWLTSLVNVGDGEEVLLHVMRALP